MSADRQRRRSSGPKIVPYEYPRKQSRQIEAIEKDGDQDVEAPSSTEVMKPLRRRMSSKFRTRETIVRLLHENNDKQGNSSAAPAAQHRQTFLSPVDWLMGPPAES
eukprot:scaffold56342_cov36-Cyclotella_meneghiniana.AAC.1